MTISYSTLGGNVTVSPSGTIPAGDLNNSVAVVGHADLAGVADGVAAGESTLVSTPTDAETQFGADSELARQAALAAANGAGTIYGIPIGTSEVTETVSGDASGTLPSAPYVDPRVTQADVTVTDTSAAEDQTVEYTSETDVTAPTTDNTVRLNPVSGDWAAQSASDYEFTLTTPDADAALATAAQLPVRTVAVCSEADAQITTAQTELNNAATDFRFSRAVVGATPGIATSDVSSYEPTTDDQRVVEVAPARGTSQGENVRAVGAIAGLLASQPINVEGSITFDSVAGLSGTAVAYPPSTAQSFERVTALTDDLTVAAGLTTAQETAFADVYKAEIIDLITEQLYERIKSYRGGSNAQSAQRRFRSQLRRTLSAQSAPNAQPPLLASGDGRRPYNVAVDTGATDSEAQVTIGIEVASIAKTVNLNVNVGPIRFDGATV